MQNKLMIGGEYTDWGSILRVFLNSIKDILDDNLLKILDVHKKRKSEKFNLHILQKNYPLLINFIVALLVGENETDRTNVTKIDDNYREMITIISARYKKKINLCSENQILVNKKKIDEDIDQNNIFAASIWSDNTMDMSSHSKCRDPEQTLIIKSQIPNSICMIETIVNYFLIKRVVEKKDNNSLICLEKFYLNLLYYLRNPNICIPANIKKLLCCANICKSNKFIKNIIILIGKLTIVILITFYKECSKSFKSKFDDKMIKKFLCHPEKEATKQMSTTLKFVCYNLKKFLSVDLCGDAKTNKIPLDLNLFEIAKTNNIPIYIICTEVLVTETSEFVRDTSLYEYNFKEKTTETFDKVEKSVLSNGNKKLFGFVAYLNKLSQFIKSNSQLFKEKEDPQKKESKNEYIKFLEELKASGQINSVYTNKNDEAARCCYIFESLYDDRLTIHWRIGSSLSPTNIYEDESESESESDSDNDSDNDSDVGSMNDSGNKSDYESDSNNDSLFTFT